jgi:hypothetical protein
MKISTLKTLIQAASDRAVSVYNYHQEVMQLIDLFESESQTPVAPPIPYNPGPIPQPIMFPGAQPPHTGGGKVPYHTICGCNSANGGNGICGCVMANKMVDPNTDTKSNWTSISAWDADDLLKS